MRAKIRHILILCMGLLTLSASAQYGTEFGQNRIQYKKFDWVFYSTTHFDIYYYSGGADFAEDAIDFLEEEFNRLTDVLGYAPYSKTKILIYNSIQDLQQSNIGVDGAQFGIGGQTDFTKLQLEVAHHGTADAFKKELIYKLSRILIEDMLFGGSLAEIFQSAYLMSLPRWFVDGAARYMAYGWSADMDDHIRDYLERKNIKKLIKVDGDEAGIVGQSVWNYIAINYGRSNVSNILNLTRIIRSEQSSISNTVGVEYKQFIKEWQAYYIEHQYEIAENYIDAPEESQLEDARNNMIKFSNVRLNPSGNKVAYSTNELGKYKVFVHDLESGNTKNIASGGFKHQGQQVDYDLPLVDWVDDDRIGVLYYGRGYLILESINIGTGDRLTKPLPRFNQVKSFSFNENGRLAILSGDVDGMNDVYLISMRRNAMRRLTKDVYDDIDPSFIPGTASVVFSSNRPSTSVNVEDISIDQIGEVYNLYQYDLDTTTTTFGKFTNTYSKDFKPLAKNPFEIYYLSDQKGIINLFKYNVLDSTFTQITNYNRSIKDYDLHFGEDKMIYLMHNEGVDNVYLESNPNLDQSKFSPQTARQRLRQAQFVTDLYEEQGVRLPEPESINEPIIETTIELPDSTEIEPVAEEADEVLVDPDDFQFEEEEEGDSEDFIDTDNYQFESPARTQSQKFRPESFFSNYQRLEISNEVIGPIQYEPQFSFDNLTTSFAIDPLRGFGALLETQISDMLGNHKLKGGALAITDLNSGDLYAEYQYLKYWMDLKFRVDRQSYFFQSNLENDLRQRYNLNRVMLGGAVPLTNWFRLEVNPFYTWTQFRNLQFENVLNRGEGAGDQKQYFAGVQTKVVFDNTLSRGYNLLEGTRASVGFDHHQGVNDSKLSFSRLRVDLRNYLGIHRELALATRVFYGTSFGPNPQTFMLGGVPNWFFARTRRHPSNDPLAISNTTPNMDLVFVEYVTDLHGFPYNEVFGSSSIVFNTQLKFPVFEYFSKAPINSTFLRNFILVAFADFGSAWTGKPPLSRKNSSNTIEYKADVFSARISNFKNPWLASYGAGVRMVLMGYYGKIDIARPIREYEVQRTRFTVSVGLDF